MTEEIMKKLNELVDQNERILEQNEEIIEKLANMTGGRRYEGLTIEPLDFED